MRIAFILLLLLCQNIKVNAQTNFAPAYGLDTSFMYVENCATDHVYEYFQVNAKYPESALSLLKRIRQKAEEQSVTLKQNGSVTFRFTINCAGIPGAYRLFLLDENYEEQKFDAATVLFFYDFVKSLKEWKIKPSQGKLTAMYYNYYLSFRIHNEKILSVAP